MDCDGSHMTARLDTGNSTTLVNAHETAQVMID
jgi:hypothetical protein